MNKKASSPVCLNIVYRKRPKREKPASQANVKPQEAPLQATTPNVEPEKPAPLHLPVPRKMVNETEAATICGMPVGSFRRIPEEKRPPFINLSPRRRLYPLDDLMQWLANVPRTNR